MAVAIGLLLSILSSLIGFTALNIQRHAQNGENKRPLLNIGGVILQLAVGPTDLVSFQFAPQSLLAPVGTLSLVLNLVAAPRLHGDKVTRHDALSTACIVFGTAICLVFGAHRGPGDDEGKGAAAVDDMGPASGVFVWYCVAVAALCSGLGAFIASLRRGAEASQAEAAANALLAGVLGSTTVVAGKGVGQAVATRHLLPIAEAVLPLAGLAPTHLYVLNRGMGRCSTVVFMPLNLSSALIANICSGVLLYKERPESFPHFAVGLVFILAGVLGLTTASKTTVNVSELSDDSSPRKSETASRAAPLELSPLSLERRLSRAERGSPMHRLSSGDLDINAFAFLASDGPVPSPQKATEPAARERADSMGSRPAAHWSLRRVSKTLFGRRQSFALDKPKMV